MIFCNALHWTTHSWYSYASVLLVTFFFFRIGYGWMLLGISGTSKASQRNHLFPVK